MTGMLPRFARVTAFVGIWMALGWALSMDPVPYLLTGIPLTLAFQVLVARRPVTAMWLERSSFRLDRRAAVVAAVLAALPIYATLLGVAEGRVLDVAYGLVGVVGAVPAAVSLRALDGRARGALRRSIQTAGLVASVLFVADRILRQGPSVTDPSGAAQAFAISLLLYLPMVFVIEEVTFRGVLDPDARGDRPSGDRASAVLVSLLWGAWHLPLLDPEEGLLRVAVTMAYHLVVGLLMTIPWRRSGNLAVPGITHALIDAVRDALAAA